MDEKLKHSLYLMMQRIRRECCIGENEYYDEIMIGILAEIYSAGALAQSKDDRGIHREQNSRPIEGGVNE
jgi:hypothetical protein